ncbi:DUF6531 domain-containing protein [Actinosynnema sp. NPDC059797]
MADFPAHLFRMEGDPSTIRSSAKAWSTFGDAATEAAGQITGLNTQEFVGPEGDQFREGLNDQMPPHLRTTGEAYRKVGTALDTFAGTLATLQDEMRPIAQRAPSLWEAVRNAQGRVSDAKEADRAHERATADRPPDQPDTYRSDAGAANAALTEAQRAWQECVDKANGLRSRMTAAADACERVIKDAEGMRFKENPKGLAKIGAAIGDFISDNVEALKSLSGALKIVSLVAGILAFIPVLTPVMLPLAVATGAAAFAIDASIYAATGQGDLKTLLIDGALLALPGIGKLAKPLVSKLVGAVRTPIPTASALHIGPKAAIRPNVATPRQTATPVSKRTCEKDPIDVATGENVLPQTDVELPGALPLVLGRTHISSYRVGRWFGSSWASTLDQRLEVDDQGVSYAADDGMLLFYPVPTVEAPVFPLEGPRRPLAVDGNGRYTITDPEVGHTLHFESHLDQRVSPLAAITDRNGNRIDLEYDQLGVLTGVTHSGGYRIGVDIEHGLITALRLLGNSQDSDTELIRYEYDTDDRLTGVINSSSLPLRFTYDGEGRITRWQDRNGTRYDYTFDSHGRCVKTAGTDGVLNGTFDYDTERMVTIVTDSLGHTTVYELNEAFQVVRKTDQRGNTTISEWDRYDRLLSRTDSLGHTTNYIYDRAGNLIEITRPDGSRTRAEYNDLQLPVELVDYDGTTWRRKYDERGNLTAVTDPTGATTTYSYNERGHLVTITDALGNTQRIETNAAGLPTIVTDRAGAITRYTYDEAGRVTTITDPIGGATRLTWTVEGKLASRTLPDGTTEHWSYDGEGNLVEHRDALGQVTRTEFTHFDLPAARTAPDGSRLRFRYDTELRLVEVVNPQGLTWRYDHDEAGNLVRETDFNGRVLTYFHDAAGRLTERINGVGQTTRFVRNPLGDVVARHSDDDTATFEHDAAGRLIRAVNGDSEVIFERDALGRVVTETCNGRSVHSKFDALGRRTRRHTPSGAESRWEYDSNDRPTALHTAGHTIRFGYDIAGREVERHLSDNVVLSQEWDTNHRLLTQTLTAGHESTRQNRLVQRRAYQYRVDGYLTRLVDHLSGAKVFNLDQVGRITAVQGQGWTEQYTYDTAGNITNAEWPADSTDALGKHEYSGTLVQRAGNVRYRHDAQGRVVLRQHKRLSAKPLTWRYTWNADDRLVSVTAPEGERWQYRYDPLGRRVAKERLNAGDDVVERIDFAWDHAVLAEQTDSTGLTTTWDWEPGTFRPVSQAERRSLRDAPQEWVDEQFHGIVTDLIGTPHELVGANGQVVWHQRASLWGAEASGSNTITHTPLRFPGQYFDEESRLNYNYHRFYDPDTNRYTSPDPLGLAASPDPHAYVTNPTFWIDPLGLAPCPSGPPRFIADSRGAIIDRQSISTKISPQKQARHLAGPGYRHGGYFNSPEEAQAVLNAFHSGEATVMGISRSGSVQVRYDSITGFNNNVAKGFINQPTNIFLIKGSSSPSVVPASPIAGP